MKIIRVKNIRMKIIRMNISGMQNNRMTTIMTIMRMIRVMKIIFGMLMMNIKLMMRMVRMSVPWTGLAVTLVPQPPWKVDWPWTVHLKEEQPKFTNYTLI